MLKEPASNGNPGTELFESRASKDNLTVGVRRSTLQLELWKGIQSGGTHRRPASTQKKPEAFKSQARRHPGPPRRQPARNQDATRRHTGTTTKHLRHATTLTPHTMQSQENFGQTRTSREPRNLRRETC
jgi:hypothetical protein